MKKAFLKALPNLILVSLVGIIFLGIDAVFSLQMMRAVDIALEGHFDQFTTEAIKLLLIALFLFPTNVLLSYTKGLYRKNAVKKMKKHYLENVFEQDLHVFHGENSAHYVSALTNDINTLETHFVDGIFEVVFSILSFVVGIAVIAYVSPYVLIAGVVLGGLSAVLSSVLSKPVQKQHKQRSELFSGYTSTIKEVLSAFHIIKVNNLTEKVSEDFGKKSKDIQDKGYSIDKIFTYISAVQNTLTMSVMVGVAGFAIYMTIQGHMTFGGIVLVINNMEKVLRPLMQLGEWMPKISSSKGLFEKLDKTLHIEAKNDETMEIIDFDNSIEVKNIDFGYDGTKVLEGASYTFEKGKKYLVVGPSGGGKTTMLKLLRKYFKPESGDLLIDGKSLSRVKMASYFKLIANIEQQVFLFEDSVKNNICLYKDVQPEALEKAIDQAGLRSFINKTPEGIEYKILDNGKNLSGGERSRIAIARGLLANAKIIYLDEAFASLDETIAKEIEETLLALDGITVVNVSHVVFEKNRSKYDAVVKVERQMIPLLQ